MKSDYTEKLAELQEILINKNAPKGPVSVFGLYGKSWEFEDGRACHYCLSNVWSWGIFGQRVNFKHSRGKEDVQYFLEWITDPKRSVFAALLKELGDQFHVIRNTSGEIIAWCVTGKWKVNRFVLFNFFKSIRIVSEHPDQFKFWCKWAIDNKKDPRLAYILSGAWNERGGGVSLGHAALETSSQKCDLRRIFNADPELWKINENTGPGSYHGEQVNTWGGQVNCRFNLAADIPRIVEKEVPTRFWTKYYGAGRVGLAMTDDCLNNFFDNVDSIYEAKTHQKLRA